MSKLQGEILTLPKMSGFVSAHRSFSGNVGAKTINIGENGDDGATFIPSVSADGVISWTNDKELPNPEPVNIKGVRGDKGDTGLSGKDGYTPIKGIDYFDGKDGSNGKDGTNGTDGVTPHIGANGNWYIGETDTGVKAQGEDGKDGDDYVLTDTDRTEIAEQAAQMVIDDAPVKSVNGKTGAVVLSASDVGADASGTAGLVMSGHNVHPSAHNDIRLLITGLTNRLDALANADDDTLDQMAEVVAYIKANRDLIEQITTNKVNVADIINNLTTNVSNKPLSAAQGVALKALIDALDNGKLNASELTAAINTALAQAKASGEFKGDKGDKGDTGEAGPVTSGAKYVISEGVTDEESVCVIEETDASVSASDNSAHFDKQYIVVENDTYKLGKEAMLSLQNKKLTGNGSVAWNGWDTQPQGWKDAEDSAMLSSKLKVRYADDPVYMSMKLPGEANISTDTLVRPAMRGADGSGTYTVVDNIGAIYPVDYTALPTDVVICIGHLSMYTLSKEKNAKWKLHDKQTIPFGQSMYYIPWSGSGDQNVGISGSKITIHDDHVRFALKRDDFAPSSSVPGSIAKCMHFWGEHNQLDLGDTLAVICFFETWIETPDAVGNLYAAIGCDQKSADLSKIAQMFWGRRVLLSTEKQVIIGHNISDALYDELRDTPNDPRMVCADYGASFSSEYDSMVKVEKHNSDTSAHPDIRDEIDTYLGDMQSRIEQVTKVVQPMEVLTPSLNKNDGVWEYGYFDESGNPVSGTAGQSFRNVNYLPVEGGRAIAIFYNPSIWNNDNWGKPCHIVQYDANKAIIRRDSVNTYVSGTPTFTLEENTAYIRLSHNKWAALGEELSAIKVAIYYAEDARREFVEYGFGSEMAYGVSSDSVYMTNKDGTTETLTETMNELAKKSDLSPMVDEALAQAKASGAFDGKDGKDGKDGTSATHSWNGTVLAITSASGTSSADLKGDKGDKGDSIKGDTGSPGADGVSPTVTVSKSGKVTTVSITDKNGTKTATINDGADGSNGSNGSNGVSATHSWSGTTLTITSASGTSSANLKGDKGDTGSTGATGKTAYAYAKDGGYIGTETSFSQKLGSLEEIILETETLVPGINLNDGVWEAGYFNSSDGKPVAGTAGQSFRNVNYLPVTGGRRVSVYYDQATWSGTNLNREFWFVQYDKNKTILKYSKIAAYGKTYLPTKDANILALESNTAYIRISMNKWSALNQDISTIKVAVYYVEDAVLSFVEYGFGSEVGFGIPSDKVYLVSPNGTKYALSVSDSGVLSVKAFGS